MTRAFLRLVPNSKLLAICLAGIVLIVALMPLHAFLSTWGGSTIGPLWLWKSWKELLLVGLVVVFVIWLAKNPQPRAELLRDPLVLAAGVYCLLTVQWAVIHIYSTGAVATAAGVAMNLRFVVILLIAYGVFRYGGLDDSAWRRVAVRFVLAAGAVLALIGLLQVTVLPKDFLANFGYDKEQTIAPFLLIDENEGALRAFATLRGANDYGAFLIMPLLTVIMLMRRHRWLAVVGVLLVMALVVSGSRSAWLGAAAAVAMLVAVSLGKRAFQSRRVWAGFAASAIVAFSLTYAALHVPALRLAIFHSSPGDSSLSEGSTDAHLDATAAGVSRVVAAPFGCGPGCAGPASYYSGSPQISENYYVQLAEEVGIVGVALWLVMVGLAAKRLHDIRDDWLARVLLAAGVGLSVIGLWLHVWSDDPLSLTYWALVGMVLGAAAKKARQLPKKLVS